MKKKIIMQMFLTLSSVVFAYGQHDHPKADSSITQAKPKSPRLNAMAMVGDNHVHIDYGSPSVRGRVIWNGLVAYNQVWATGAHRATSIDFSKDVVIQGTLIPKGKYGFFTIPGEKEWILIISKTWDMHLADDYNDSNDVLRLKVKPNKNNALVEALTYEVVQLGNNKGRITMSWENLNISFEFESK